ncbi:MAG TPA: phosphatase [Firmicutes bacterium]|nr:phosphatase [Bacillota bacterium]
MGKAGGQCGRFREKVSEKFGDKYSDKYSGKSSEKLGGKRRSVPERKTVLSTQPAPYAVAADLHCHTVASTHAFSTVTELARAAAQRGLAAVGCTDHAPAMPDAPHLWHFQNLKSLPDRIEGVRVLRGAEANVLGPDGRLDLEAEALQNLELVIASMHRQTMPPSSPEECTAAWLAVAANPFVDIIGHSGTPQFAYDYERVIPEFGRQGKAVEINEGTFRVRKSSVPNCRRIAELCKKHGVFVSLDSDAHFHGQVGLFPHCRALLREVGFPKELIVNGSVESLSAFFRRRGRPVSL